jgi:predicted MPP superfamily phosphohydrolase
VDYEPLGERERYLTKADGLADPEAVNVLLSHNPDLIPAAVRKGFDVTLAGHTHGGQVTLEILHPWVNVARYFTPYVYGKYELTEGGRFGSAFVTRGAGTIVVPMRLCAPPEIALVRLCPAIGERNPGVVTRLTS